jgi:hypothetical protein
MRIHSLCALAVLLFACSSSDSTPVGDDTTGDQAAGGAGAGGTTSAGGSGGGAKDGGKTDGPAAAGGATGMGGGAAAGGAKGTGGSTGSGGGAGWGGNGAGGTTTSDLTGTCTAADDPSAATINLSIDRSAVPHQVGFRELTLKVKVNTATAVAVKVDGQSPPCAYDSTSGTVLFTTAGASVVISVSGGQPSSAGFGTFTKAALKDDKNWAYSFGFDDDQMFKEHGITFAESLGLRGTLFVMNKDNVQLFSAGRNEGWTLGEDDLPVFERGGSVDDTNPVMTFTSTGGWGIGNHSFSHSYVADLGGAAAAKADVVKMQDKLVSILGIPGTDSYKIIAFAAPMFDASYEPVIQDIRDHDPAHQLLFDESGSSMPLQVDGPLDRNASIGRANTYGFGNGSQDDPKTVVAGFRSKLDATHHYWLNTLDHGVDSSWPNGAFFQWLQYFHDNYGKGGTNEAWNVPSDRIYSYLLVRDLSAVTKP